MKLQADWLSIKYFRHHTITLSIRSCWTCLVGHSVAVLNKCGVVLTTEVGQVLFDLLVLHSGSSSTPVKMQPDRGSWRHFDLCNALCAISGLPWNTVTFWLLASHSKMENMAFSIINTPERQSWPQVCKLSESPVSAVHTLINLKTIKSEVTAAQNMLHWLQMRWNYIYYGKWIYYMLESNLWERGERVRQYSPNKAELQPSHTN